MRGLDFLHLCSFSAIAQALFEAEIWQCDTRPDTVSLSTAFLRLCYPFHITLSFILGVLADLPFRGFILFWYICSSRYHAAVDTWLSSVSGLSKSYLSWSIRVHATETTCTVFSTSGVFRNGFVFESDACSFWILLTRAYPDERMRFCCLQLVHYMYTYIVLLYMYR